MPAIAHQNKILGNTSGGGSTILVTTSESTLYGQTVTLSDGTTTMSGTFSNAGECEFTGVMMVGTLTASSGGASTSIQVPYFGVYSMSLAFFSATITVTYSGGTCTCVGNGESYTASGSPYTFTVHGAATYTITVTIDGISKTDTVTITTDGQSESVSIEFGTINVNYDNDFRGTSITCTQGGTTITKTAPSGANTMTFYPPTTGNWVISGTVSGTPYSKTANVTSLSTSVSVSLETVPDGKTTTPTDDIEKWLQCGQITGKSYTTLSQVLADAETYERLLSDSNACDYMARSTTWASTICADADAMMRLGKYDYACDALLADSTWCTAICGSTYFEYVLDVKVPKMTSNTTPSGQVIYSRQATNLSAYKAFDNDTNTLWVPVRGTTSITGNFIGYKFTSPVCVKYASINFNRYTDCVLEASNDNDTYTPLKSISLGGGDAQQTDNEVITNDTAYLYYRIRFTANSTDADPNIAELQFYGRHTAQTDIIVTAHGGDTVYYMENGSPVTLTTADSDTGIGTVDWSDLPKGAITLYSSTAKNPSDLTADYSKTVYITEYTTQIYLMPDNALYWWGYMTNACEEVSVANGWSFTNATFKSPTYNTSNVYCQADANNVMRAVGSKSAVNITSAVHAIGLATLNGAYGGSVGICNKSDMSSTYDVETLSNTLEHKVVNRTGTYNVLATSGLNHTNRSLTLSALWYE